MTDPHTTVAQQLRPLVDADPALQQALHACRTSTEAAALLCQAATSAGLVLPADAVGAALEATRARVAPLSDAELDHMAGGFGGEINSSPSGPTVGDLWNSFQSLFNPQPSLPTDPHKVG